MNAASNRVVFIDLLRGWAGILMIEVHAVNAFLKTEYRSASWFSLLDFVNGLVAPAFLFVAGLVFTVAGEQNVGEFRRIRRILLIWSIGYALHLPVFSWQKISAGVPDALWLSFYQVDILHCIAAGLLLLLGTRLVLRRRCHCGIALITVGMAIVLAAPLVWELPWEKFFHPALAAYFDGHHLSLFPLFPWMGFLLFGAVVGVLYRSAVEAGAEHQFARSLGLWSGGLVLCGTLFRLPVDIRVDPFFFFLRLGLVLLLLLFFRWYALKRETRGSFVLDISRETLLVYTAHLLIIYGTFWNSQSLAGLLGPTRTPVEVLAGTAGLVLLMVAAAKGWRALKTSYRATARAVAWTAGLLVIIIFFIK